MNEDHYPAGIQLGMTNLPDFALNMDVLKTKDVFFFLPENPLLGESFFVGGFLKQIFRMSAAGTVSDLRLSSAIAGRLGRMSTPKGGPPAEDSWLMLDRCQCQIILAP